MGAPTTAAAAASNNAALTSVEGRLPIRMVSKVVHGFGRGSKELGIPTANLDRAAGVFHSTMSFDDLPTGIYWGFARIGNNASAGSVYTTACSIGYNPTYANEAKTIEPHLIAPPSDPNRHASSCGESLLTDFYDQPIRLSLVGYLRPELPFEGLPKLVEAIKNDIVQSEDLGNHQASSDLAGREHDWVASSDEL